MHFRIVPNCPTNRPLGLPKPSRQAWWHFQAMPWPEALVTKSSISLPEAPPGASRLFPELFRSFRRWYLKSWASKVTRFFEALRFKLFFCCAQAHLTVHVAVLRLESQCCHGHFCAQVAVIVTGLLSRMAFEMLGVKSESFFAALRFKLFFFVRRRT